MFIETQLQSSKTFIIFKSIPGWEIINISQLLLQQCFCSSIFYAMDAMVPV